MKHPPAGRSGAAVRIREDVRLAVYRSFADTGRAPSVEALAASLNQADAAIRTAIAELAGERHLVIDDRANILMAHPFSAIPMGFVVMGQRTLWWGGCAWDSFALPHLLPGEPSVLVATTCPACNKPHSWVVSRQQPPDGEQVAHFLIPADRMWEDVVHTCRHQRIFCNERCVADWLAGTGNKRGSILQLPQLWRLASRWYEGRLDRGYARREPSAAKAYFTEVGLDGAFWGL